MNRTPTQSSIVHRPSSVVCILFSAFCLLSPVFCLLFVAPGCDAVRSVSPDQVRSFAADVNAMNTRVDAYQAATTAAIEQLQAQNAIDPNVAEKVLAANADVDNLQSVIRSISAGLQAAEYSGGDGLLTLIQGAQAANAASAPWNPYFALIAAALTILSTVLGIAVKNKSAEASAVGAKYQAHKRGVEKTMKLASLSEIPDTRKFETILYESIGEARAKLGVT